MNLFSWLKSMTIRMPVIKIRLTIISMMLMMLTFAITVVFLTKTQTFSPTMSDSDTAIIRLSDRQEAYDLSERLKFLEDKDSNLTIEQVSSAEFSNQFKYSDRRILAIRHQLIGGKFN